jgi:hypothetical protein
VEVLDFLGKGMSRWTDSPGSSVSSNRRLSQVELLEFHRHGWLGPYLISDLSLVDQVRQIAQKTPRSERSGRHLDLHTLFRLCVCEEVLDRVEGLLGPDVVLFQSRMWVKRVGAGRLGWHQDVASWPMHPPLAVSAWIALEDVRHANGCMQLASGSHRRFHAHEESDGVRIVPGFSPSQLVSMELGAGQFFLFSGTLVHASEANATAQPRHALAVRFTTPSVSVDRPQPHILVRGRDRFGLHPLVSPPTE